MSSRLRAFCAAFLVATFVVAAVPPVPSTPVSADCIPSQTQDCPRGTSPIIYIVIAGGAYLIYRLFAHHKAEATATPSPMTTSRPPGVTETPPPTAPPTAEPSYPPPPTPYPSPPPTPTQEPCFIKVTDGWFEPVQDSYQDDPVFMSLPVRYTAERADKESPPQFHAGLDMVTGKDSVLIGVEHYYERDKLKTPVSRTKIVVMGYSTCSTVIKKVKLDFELSGTGGTQSVYKSDILGQIKTQGGLKAPEPFVLVVDAPKGVPNAPKTFKFARGNYTISAIIKDDRDNDLGLPRVTVSGNVVDTAGPTTRLLPVLLTTKTNRFDNAAAELEHAAKSLQWSIQYGFPDIYPLKTGGMPQPEIGATVRLQIDSIVDRDWVEHHGIYDLNHYEANLMAALNDKIATAATQDKVGRTIVIMDNGDFARIVGFHVLGYTVSTKVVMMPIRADEWTVAHEIAHTLPTFLWSSDQMLSQCGKTYHNLDGKYAHGVEVTAYGQTDIRRRVAGDPKGIMQAGHAPFIEQCTYHNLLGALQNQIDPPVTLLRGLVSLGPTGPVAGFKPAYDLESTLEMRADPKSPYAIVVRNSKGQVRATYPFRMPLHDDSGHAHVTMPFALRIPQLPNDVRVELRGPNGTLATLRRAAKPPTLVVRATLAPLSNMVHVEWKAKSANGGPVVASVATARTNGRFETTVFETTSNSADVLVDKKGSGAVIRVIVSDGGRSTTKIVPVKLISGK